MGKVSKRRVESAVAKPQKKQLQQPNLLRKRPKHGIPQPLVYLRWFICCAFLWYQEPLQEIGCPYWIYWLACPFFLYCSVVLFVDFVRVLIDLCEGEDGKVDPLTDQIWEAGAEGGIAGAYDRMQIALSAVDMAHSETNALEDMKQERIKGEMERRPQIAYKAAN